MKREFIKVLVCPECKDNVTLKSFDETEKNIIEGLLFCERCSCLYPIINRIPRMLHNSLYENIEFLKKHEKIISGYLPNRKSGELKGTLSQLQKETIDKFSYEWKTYSTFGWEDPVYNIDYERQVFSQKTLFDPCEFKDRIVLDAGCGNGRYLHWASQYGANLAIGIDIGYSVDVAQENLKNAKNVELVQCDLFHLPFKEDFFDIIFSIGVLMHTGNARKATESLVKILKQNGKISVHLYHKSNILYEFLDILIRKYTTKLPSDKAILFTKHLYTLAKILYALHIGNIINGLILRIDNHPHCIFDWYTAPVATHHDYDEIYQWFNELGVEVIADLNVDKGLLKEIIKPLKLLVVKGRKKRERMRA